MNEELHVNIPDMDKRHDEFLEILSKIHSCKKEEFLSLFLEMIEHTEEHFAYEEELMQQFDFYGMQEHMEEHKNLLDEMRYFYAKAQKLPAFGKSYINDYAREKFKRHVINIDSQLAMFLKEKELKL
jgi:hemerythrin